MDDTVHHKLAKALAEIERLRDQVNAQGVAEDSHMEEIARLSEENQRLRAALGDLITAYIDDVNPNDRNERAITHARQAYQ